MSTFAVLKDPDAVLDYSINWEPWLADGDTIATSEWIVTGPDSTLEVDSSGKSTTVTTVWLSGGTLGQVYTVTNRVVTTEGRTDDRSIGFQMVDK
jgi:hypothetical protein